MNKKFRVVFQAGLFLSFFCFLLSPIAWAKRFQSGPAQTAVIELFSSEGCSSCPPADAWMNRLQTSPGLWKDFIPAAFHVDYWDYLGWKDPFGSPRFSSRQRAYASRWKHPSVYTPGVMLNGREWRGWYQGQTAEGSVQDAGVLTVETAEGNQQSAVYKPGTNGANSPRAHAAVLGFGLVSHVKTGENRGKTLVHDFVVLQYAEKSMVFQSGEYRVQFNLDAERPAAEKKAVLIWVSDPKNFNPIQAAGGYL